jgi:hypothetical protein
MLRFVQKIIKSGMKRSSDKKNVPVYTNEEKIQFG